MKIFGACVAFMLVLVTSVEAAIPIRKTQGCNVREDRNISIDGSEAAVRSLVERLTHPSLGASLRERLWYPRSAALGYVSIFGSGASGYLFFHPWLDHREILREIDPVLRAQGVTPWVTPQQSLCYPTTGYPWTTQWVSEHYDAVGDQYRLAANDDEREALRAELRWRPTGEGFRSYGPNFVTCSPHFDQVVRLVGVPGSAPDTHVLTTDPGECGALWNSGIWSVQGRAFYAFRPHYDGYRPIETVCAPGMMPVHRFYNGRAAEGATNHRYATSESIIGEMIRKGWHHEGVGFCVWPDD